VLEAPYRYGSLHAKWDHTVTCHPAEAASPALTPAVLVLDFPPVTDEMLSRPEPTQANDLPGVATEVLAAPGVTVSAG